MSLFFPHRFVNKPANLLRCRRKTRADEEEKGIAEWLRRTDVKTVAWNPTYTRGGIRSNLTVEETTIEDRGEEVAMMEPLLVRDSSPQRSKLADLSIALTEKSASLRSSLPTKNHQCAGNNCSVDELLLLQSD